MRSWTVSLNASEIRFVRCTAGRRLKPRLRDTQSSPARTGRFSGCFAQWTAVAAGRLRAFRSREFIRQAAWALTHWHWGSEATVPYASDGQASASASSVQTNNKCIVNACQ